MLKVTKWFKHDPFRLFYDYLIDDITCLEAIGNVTLKYDDDDEDDDDDMYDDDDDDDGDYWKYDDIDESEEDDDDEDEDEDDDDDNDYWLDDIIAGSDRWVVCEDDYYGESDTEAEDAETIN